MDVTEGARRKARKKYIAALNRQRRYVVRYFIVWPPPHSTWTGGSRRDRGMWYWVEHFREWSSKKENGTAYETRQEAQDKAVIAAVARTQMSPNAEQFGKVRTSRQLVQLVRVDMSEV